MRQQPTDLKHGLTGATQTLADGKVLKTTVFVLLQTCIHMSLDVHLNPRDSERQRKKARDRDTSSWVTRCQQNLFLVLHTQVSDGFTANAERIMLNLKC